MLRVYRPRFLTIFALAAATSLCGWGHLSTSHGLRAAEVPPGDKKLADSTETADQSQQAQPADPADSPERIDAGPAFRGIESVSISDRVELFRSVRYAGAGETRRMADVYRPQGDGPFPAILMLHGGGWFSGDKVQVTSHAEYAAEQGYVVVAANYRLAPINKFPTQVTDCRAALTWLFDHAESLRIDATRVAIYGYSAGGHLACLVAMSDLGLSEKVADEGDLRNDPQHKVKAVVAGGAPCEFGWIPSDSKALAYWLQDSREANPETYRQASPLTHVDANDPPTFFFHGDQDSIVPLSSPQQMQGALRALGISTRFHIEPGADHLQTFMAEGGRQEAIKFLNETLEVRP